MAGERPPEPEPTAGDHRAADDHAHDEADEAAVFRTRFREVRATRPEWSLQDIADMIRPDRRCSAQHLRNLLREPETGRSALPRIDLVYELARIFGVQVSYLVPDNPAASQLDQAAALRQLGFTGGELAFRSEAPRMTQEQAAQFRAAALLMLQAVQQDPRDER